MCAYMWLQVMGGITTMVNTLVHGNTAYIGANILAPAGLLYCAPTHPHTRTRRLYRAPRDTDRRQTHHAPFSDLCATKLRQPST